MKATGIVRRIDDLGRVVIPKEIRRTIRIREGDTLHIVKKIKSGRVLLYRFVFYIVFKYLLSAFAASVCPFKFGCQRKPSLFLGKWKV